MYLFKYPSLARPHIAHRRNFGVANHEGSQLREPSYSSYPPTHSAQPLRASLDSSLSLSLSLGLGLKIPPIDNQPRDISARERRRLHGRDEALDPTGIPQARRAVMSVRFVGGEGQGEVLECRRRRLVGIGVPCLLVGPR